MVVLEKAKDVNIKMLGLQKIKPDTVYRPFFYVKTYKPEKGLIILNLMTFQMIYLEENEINSLHSPKCLDNLLEKFLIENWFLVPENNDDIKLVKQVETLLCLTKKNIYCT